MFASLRQTATPNEGRGEAEAAVAQDEGEGKGTRSAPLDSSTRVLRPLCRFVRPHLHFNLIGKLSSHITLALLHFFSYKIRGTARLQFSSNTTTFELNNTDKEKRSSTKRSATLYTNF